MLLILFPLIPSDNFKNWYTGVVNSITGFILFNSSLFNDKINTIYKSFLHSIEIVLPILDIQLIYTVYWL